MPVNLDSEKAYPIEVILDRRYGDDATQVRALLERALSTYGVSHRGGLWVRNALEESELSPQVPTAITAMQWLARLLIEQGAEGPVLARGEDYEPEPVEEAPEPDRALVAARKLDPRKVSSSGAKRILVLDIETTMAVKMFYSLYKDFASPKDVIAPGSILCFAAKWVGDPCNTFYFVDRRKGYRRMLEILWALLNEADYVVTWNGDRFDLPKIEGQFLRVGLGRPSPSKSIDLMKAAKSLGFESKGLDYVGRMLSTSRKVAGAGAAGWKDCLGIVADPVAAGMNEAEHAVDTVRRIVTCELEETPEMTAAWRGMKEYNKGDIQATEDLFFVLAPFIKNLAIHDSGCILCGTQEYAFIGYHETPASRWQVRRCSDCGTRYRVGSAERRSTELMARPF